MLHCLRSNHRNINSQRSVYVPKSYGGAPGQDQALTLRTNQFLRSLAICNVREPPHLRSFLFVVPPALLTVFPPQNQPHNDAEPDGAKYERARKGNRKPGNHDQPERNNRAGTRSGHRYVAKRAEGCGPLPFGLPLRQKSSPCWIPQLVSTCLPNCLRSNQRDFNPQAEPRARSKGPSHILIRSYVH